MYEWHRRVIEKKSFYSQLPLHFSFMELAEYSQNGLPVVRDGGSPGAFRRKADFGTQQDALSGSQVVHA
jgi:hypothetical protein